MPRKKKKTKKKSSRKKAEKKKKESKEKESSKEAKKEEELVRPRPAWVINRLRHSVTLSYNGYAMVLAPRAKELIADIERLSSAIPKGVSVIKDDNQKR